MLILNDEGELLNHEQFITLERIALSFYKNGNKEMMSFQLRFRCSMFVVCCSIQVNRLAESLKLMNDFIENHKKKVEEGKENLFQRSFLFGKSMDESRLLLQSAHSIPYCSNSSSRIE